MEINNKEKKKEVISNEMKTENFSSQSLLPGNY